MSSDLQDKLLEAAAMVMKNAYNPYSGYQVGAALQCADGRVFTGCNVESASFGATICAERTALCGAVAAGAQDFTVMAIVASGNTPYPCGICRQMLYELAPGLMLIMCGQDGQVKTACISELLPMGFTLVE